MFPVKRAVMGFGLLALGACATPGELPPATAGQVAEAPEYVIGPLDGISVFVWRNPELSTSTTVRPDGKITVPLVEDLTAAGKSPAELAREIEGRLSDYIVEPVVSVTVGGYVGSFSQQVRVVGAAAEPRAIPYRAGMTALDVMIEVGGLTPYAAGNRATLIRMVDGEQQRYRVRLADLLQDGDVSANPAMRPGDVLIIPESYL